MNGKLALSLALMCIPVTGVVAQGAEITFLNHFNSTDHFNADFGAAPNAIITGTPESGSGFPGFGAGSKGVTLDYLTDWINYEAVGNVVSTDGLSLGFWVTQTHDSALNGVQYHHYAGILREDFPQGRDSLNATYSGGSSYFSEVVGDAPGDTPAFYRRRSDGWHHLIPGQWLYYNVDYKAPQAGVPDSGHYRIRVYNDQGDILAGVGGDVAGLIPLSPGQQDVFEILSNMVINIGAGTLGVTGVARQITIDEFAVWNGSLTTAEVDAFVASMVAGNELVPEPGAITLSLGIAALMLGRRTRRA